MQSNKISQPSSNAASRISRRSLFATGAIATLMAGTQAADAKTPLAETKHRIVILIDSDDEKVMGHAISYSMNITRSYALKNEIVQIEIVANGSGIKLFRADISPLQEPLAALRQTLPNIVFSMCDSSRKIAEQKEGHSIDLIDNARVVPFGIGRVVELQQNGWSYIHG